MRSFIFIQFFTISASIDRCAIAHFPPLSIFTIIRESYDLDNFIINCSVIFCNFYYDITKMLLLHEVRENSIIYRDFMILVKFIVRII